MLNALVLKYSKLWVKHKILELEVDGTNFTYDLMEDVESHSEGEEETTKHGIAKLPSEEWDKSQFIIKRRTKIQAKGKEKRKPIVKTRKSSKEIIEEGTKEA